MSSSVAVPRLRQKVRQRCPARQDARATRNALTSAVKRPNNSVSRAGFLDAPAGHQRPATHGAAGHDERLRRRVVRKGAHDARGLPAVEDHECVRVSDRSCASVTKLTVADIPGRDAVLRPPTASINADAASAPTCRPRSASRRCCRDALEQMYEQRLRIY